MFRLFVFCLGFHFVLCALPFKAVNVSENFEPYIVQGEDAEEGKYLYQVSLHVAYNSKRHHLCGASVLTKYWVLTAGHCCAAGGYDVLVGTSFLSRGGQSYKTYNYKIHPDYDAKNNWKNDICLIKTLRPIQFSNTVQPVTLPPQGKELKDGDLVTVTGWGYTKPDNRVVPDRLQVGKNFVAISNKKCGPLTNITMFDGYLCVNGNREGQGICQIMKNKDYGKKQEIGLASAKCF